MTKQDFIKAGFQEWHNGGGNMVMAKVAETKYVLISDQDDCHLSYTQDMVSIGMYDSETDECVQDLVDVNIDEATSTADGMLSA